MVGRQNALEYMVKQGLGEEQLAEVRRGLQAQGWQEDPSLPQGFLKRNVLGKVTQV